MSNDIFLFIGFIALALALSAIPLSIWERRLARSRREEEEKR